MLVSRLMRFFSGDIVESVRHLIDEVLCALGQYQINRTFQRMFWRLCWIVSSKNIRTCIYLLLKHQPARNARIGCAGTITLTNHSHFALMLNVSSSSRSTHLHIITAIDGMRSIILPTGRAFGHVFTPCQQWWKPAAVFDTVSFR